MPPRVLYVIPGAAEGPSYIFARRQVEALERAGVAAERFFLDTRMSLRSLARQRAKYREVIDRFRPDLVHAHYGTLTSFFCVAGSRAPLVITFRGSDLLPDYDVSRPRVWLGHLFSQVSALGAAGIICVSDELRRRLWWSGCRRRAVVITETIDLDLFKPMPRHEARKTLGWGPDDRVVLFNLNGAPRRKRIDLARAAVEQACAQVPQARLVVMDGVPPDQVPVMMNAADALVLTSRAEGSPTVVKEAMACGLPVVSVAVGDVVERLKDVRPSKIAEARLEALGQRLAEVLRQGARSNGREVLQRDLPERGMIEGILAVYRRATGAGA